MFGGARESTGQSLEASINASLARRLTAVGAAAAIVVTTAAVSPSPGAPAAADQAAAQLALQRRVTADVPAARSLVRHPQRVMFPPAPAVRQVVAVRKSIPNEPVREKARPRARPRPVHARVQVRERARPVVRHHRPKAVPHRPRAVPERSTVSHRVPARAVAPRRAAARPVARHTARPARSARHGNPVVKFAESQLGRPYVRKGTGQRGWDCSGLTRAAFARIGKRMPHKAASQHGKALRRGQARPGDLVKWGNYHVGIYVGHGKVIHAPKPGDRVKRSPLWGSYRIVRVR